ncbi:MAG: dienelactone hydrolase family protein [Hyphomicrobiales bacterium]|nr:dienelactone hydrolase family protein [Hyphomicrobiales bacterium]
MSAALDGPRLPASGGRANGLVVFLHGYGADGNDLIELGRQWRALLPQAAFVSPHAPERCLGAPMGRQWFALSNRPPDDPAGAEDRWNGVVKARGAVDAFLDAELQRLGLDDSKLALVGFSQGTMMALHVGLRRSRAPAAIVGFSGMLVGEDRLKEATARDARGAPPPVLLIHGDQDPLIPLEAMFVAAEALAGAQVPTQWHLSLGIGHGIDAGGLQHAGLFLAQALTGRRG